MNKKLNNGGELQPYVPKGNGDKSGEFTFNNSSIMDNMIINDNKYVLSEKRTKDEKEEAIKNILRNAKANDKDIKEIINCLNSTNDDKNYSVIMSVYDIDSLIDYLGSLVKSEDLYKIMSKIKATQKKNIEFNQLIGELKKTNYRYSLKDIIDICKINGKIIWLENGMPTNNSKSFGLSHMIERHKDSFKDFGISVEEIADVIMACIKNNNVVLEKDVNINNKTISNIYSVSYNGNIINIAITISFDGKIIQANPVGDKRFDSYLRKKKGV